MWSGDGAYPAFTVVALPPYRRQETSVVPIRWLHNGAAASVALLDANLELQPHQGERSRLALTGTCQLPGLLPPGPGTELPRRLVHSMTGSLLSRTARTLDEAG